jgi:hypothetical protein
LLMEIIKIKKLADGQMKWHLTSTGWKRNLFNIGHSHITYDTVFRTVVHV